jgi:hypothetical protein
MTRPRFPRSTSSILSLCLLVLGVAVPYAGGQDMTRNLWDTEFLQKRPQGTSTPKKNTTYKRTKRPAQASVAKPAAPATVPTKLASDSVLGVTLWRLRPSKASDSGVARLLVHEKEGDSGVEWVPERIDTNTPISEGQRVRLAVEVPRDGYLYVIDRELYKDGSRSKSYLIFPTNRLRGGSNAVSAGAVVEIPGQTDAPGYLTLLRSRPDHVAEEIMLLVTPQPLDDLDIGDEAIELSSETVAQWEKQWGGTFEQLDLEGGTGAAYTASELKAGSGGAKLTQADPLPQTIFKVAAAPGNPFLVRLPLLIR